MDAYDLTTLTIEEPPPRPRYVEHETCAKACPCYTRGTRDEKERQRGREEHASSLRVVARLLLYVAALAGGALVCYCLPGR